MSKFPLTNFIVAMMKANTDQIKRANPEKMAAKYGINPVHCRELIQYELTQRGARKENREGQLELL